MIIRPEKEKNLQVLRAIVSSEFDLDDRYPPLQRLGIIKQPIVLAARNTYLFDKERIWSQIPLAGTLLIPLSAYTKTVC